MRAKLNFSGTVWYFTKVYKNESGEKIKWIFKIVWIFDRVTRIQNTYRRAKEFSLWCYYQQDVENAKSKKLQHSLQSWSAPTYKSNLNYMKEFIKYFEKEGLYKV